MDACVLIIFHKPSDVGYGELLLSLLMFHAMLGEADIVLDELE